eukprot:2429898-Amphidinium_carterae.1
MVVEPWASVDLPWAFGRVTLQTHAQSPGPACSALFFDVIVDDLLDDTTMLAAELPGLRCNLPVKRFYVCIVVWIHHRQQHNAKLDHLLRCDVSAATGFHTHSYRLADILDAQSGIGTNQST